MTTVKRPWKSTELQPITLVASRPARRQPSEVKSFASRPAATYHQPASFYSEVTQAIEYVPGYQKSRSRSCSQCSSSVGPSDCYCGYCGADLHS